MIDVPKVKQFMHGLTGEAEGMLIGDELAFDSQTSRSAGETVVFRELTQGVMAGRATSP